MRPQTKNINKLNNTIMKNITETLQELFTENTGTHFLDSGGDNGRQWQRNQKRNFEDEPEAVIEWYKGKFEDVTVNTYKYFQKVLDTDEITESINEIIEQNNWHWTDEVDIDLIYDKGIEIEPKGKQWNTYNGEYNCDHVFLGKFIEIYGEAYVLLQLHLGADVRGGYSNVKCFKLEGMLSGYVGYYIYNEGNTIDSQWANEFYNAETGDYVDNEWIDENIKEDGRWSVELNICEEHGVY